MGAKVSKSKYDRVVRELSAARATIRKMENSPDAVDLAVLRDRAKSQSGVLVDAYDEARTTFVTGSALLMQTSEQMRLLMNNSITGIEAAVRLVDESKRKAEATPDVSHDTIDRALNVLRQQVTDITAQRDMEAVNVQETAERLVASEAKADAHMAAELKYEQEGCLGLALGQKLAQRMPAGWSSEGLVDVRKDPEKAKALWIVFVDLYTWATTELLRLGYGEPRDSEEGGTE